MLARNINDSAALLPTPLASLPAPRAYGMEHLWSELEKQNPGIAELKLFVHRLLRESRVDQIHRLHQQQLRENFLQREILRLHEALEVRTQAIREQHAVEMSKLKRDKGEHIVTADIVMLRRTLEELRDQQAVGTAKYEAQRVAHNERESWWLQRSVADDKRINELEVQLFWPSVFGRAAGIIEEHGPLVSLSKLAGLLYAADERARPAVAKAKGMKAWLLSMPQTFELHGEGQPGYEQVSLRGSTKRPPTEAGLEAAARLPAGSACAGASGLAPPVHQGSDAASSGDTSDAKVKMHMGRAAAWRDLATGDHRRKLSAMIHVRDRDPHKHGHNNFVDEATGRPSEERMRAELEKGKKARRAKSAPRGRPSADQVLAARTSGDR